jgi:hypothetical protein
MRTVPIIALAFASISNGFTLHSRRHSQFKLKAKDSPVEEYKNVATSILSNFMQDENESMNTGDKSEPQNNVLSNIAFDAPKVKKLPLGTLAQILDYELFTKEWFVTGNVNPIYFSDNFEFQDPDVKLVGIENYAKGVNKLFDQNTSRAQIKCVEVNPNMENTITVTWRLSGNVNIGPGGGLPIKPYICYTDFKIDPTSGLIVFQEDRFDIPQWDILLSALFPFLIGKVTKKPADPITRDPIPVMPNLERNVFGWQKETDGKMKGLSMEEVKKFGLSGTLAYVLTELIFWTIAFPVASTALYQSSGHWPDVLHDGSDRATVLGFIFAGANIARLLVPLRLGAAIALAPWVDENIIRYFESKK